MKFLMRVIINWVKQHIDITDGRTLRVQEEIVLDLLYEYVQPTIFYELLDNTNVLTDWNSDIVSWDSNSQTFSQLINVSKDMLRGGDYSVGKNGINNAEYQIYRQIQEKFWVWEQDDWDVINSTEIENICADNYEKV